MKSVIQAEIINHKVVRAAVMEMDLYAGEITAECMPGQFIHVRVGDTAHPLLRRPISIASVNEETKQLKIIYRVIGEGTQKLSQLKTGQVLDVMGPLGQGFDLACERPLLVGGGMGIAPLIYLAAKLSPRPVDVLIGGRNKQEMFWPEYFKTVTRNVFIATDDGSMGQKGFTPEVLPSILNNGAYDRIYTCGPKPMMEQIVRISRERKITCQVSLEDYMACGIGACLSCTCQTQAGRKKVCTDGPVFWAEEVFD